MNKKRALGIIICITMVVTIGTGCGKSSDPNDLHKYSKDQLIDSYNTLNTAYTEQIATNEQLQKQLSALMAEGEVTPAISVVGDGTGRLTFNSTDSKIIFPNTFGYPGSEPITPDGKIYITSSVALKPASNWISRINGSALDIEQSTTGISGTIKINQITNGLTPDSLKEEVLQPWFDQVAYTTVNYSNIFMGGTTVGMQAETPILIDSENAYLICGMAAAGKSTITYVFVYRGSNDSTKDELIKTLINSMTVDGNQITINY